MCLLWKINIIIIIFNTCTLLLCDCDAYCEGSLSSSPSAHSGHVIVMVVAMVSIIIIIIDIWTFMPCNCVDLCKYHHHQHLNIYATWLCWSLRKTNIIINNICMFLLCACLKSSSSTFTRSCLKIVLFNMEDQHHLYQHHRQLHVSAIGLFWLQQKIIIIIYTYLLWDCAGYCEGLRDSKTPVLSSFSRSFQ